MEKAGGGMEKTGGGMEKTDEVGDSNNFWYSFSVGSMGGMVTSVPALILVMPLLIYQKRQQMQENSGA